MDEVEEVDPDWVLGDLERLQQEIEEKKMREAGGGGRSDGGSEASSALSVPTLDLKHAVLAPSPPGDGVKGGDATITPRLVELELAEDPEGDEAVAGVSCTIFRIASCLGPYGGERLLMTLG